MKKSATILISMLLSSDAYASQNLSPGVISGSNIQLSKTLQQNLPNANNAFFPGWFDIWSGNDAILGKYSGSNVLESWVTPPETLSLGGAGFHHDGFLNVHCSPYANSNSGTCAQIMMGAGDILGNAAGIGPGPSATSFPSYDGFDAAITTEQAAQSTPKWVITSNKASNVFPPASDGEDHTPIFSSGGATFANPLPKDMSTWLLTHQQNIRLMTNLVGCRTCEISTYAGTIYSIETNSAGLVTGITVRDGWRVLGSGYNEPGQIPGQTTTDGSAPSIDTIWSDYKTPALMVGVWTHTFGDYKLVATNGPTPELNLGSINLPNNGTANQVRTGELAEWDLWNFDPVPLRANDRGLTLAFSLRGSGAQPSYDSYDFNAAGPNSISYKQSGEYWTIPFSGANFIVSSYDGTPYAAGSKKNVVQWRQSENIGYTADGGYERNNIMPGIWTVRNVDTNCTSTATQQCVGSNGSSKYITTNIGVQIDWYGASNKGPNGDPLWNSPTQEHIELNPKSSFGAVGLCANGQTDTNCGILSSPNSVSINNNLNVTGTTTFTNSINAQKGIIAGQSGVTLANPNAKIKFGSGPTVGTDTDGDLVINNGSGGVNLAWLSFSQLGQPLYSGVIKYCRDCYSSQRNTGSNATGIIVTWNGSNWVDGIGNPILH